MTTAKPLPSMSAAEYRTPKNEKDLQRQIVTTAKGYGWKVVHYPYAIGADRGYPDLTCVHPGGDYWPLWIEVKGPNPKIYPQQIEWLAAINASGSGLGIMAFPTDLDAVCALLAGEPVDVYDDARGFKRVRLIEEP